MRKVLLTIAVLFAISLSGASLAVDGNATQGTVAIPAIYLPSGANIVTEINVSDDNVLGIVKTAASALLDDLENIDITAVCPMPLPDDLLKDNLRKLVESTYGIKNIRFLAAEYKTSPQQFIRQFEIGVPKAGNFSRILMDTSNGDVAVVIYALPDNAGYLGAVYDPRARMIYAARMVGFVDVEQFMDVVGDVIKAYVAVQYAPAAQQHHEDIPETTPTPESE